MLPWKLTIKDLYCIIPTNPELFTMELEGSDLLPPCPYPLCVEKNELPPSIGEAHFSIN